MLDLKKMEEKLDAVLSKETPESLSKWLQNERSRNKSIECNSSEEYYACVETFNEDQPEQKMLPAVEFLASDIMNIIISEPLMGEWMMPSTLTYTPDGFLKKPKPWLQHIYYTQINNIFKKKTPNVPGSFFFINLVT